MSTISSSPIISLNLPNPKKLRASFIYRYFTKDETSDESNINAYTDSYFKEKYGAPRCIMLEFDAVTNLDDSENGALFSEHISDILSTENINKITSELMMQSNGYTKLTSEILTMQNYAQNSSTGTAINTTDAFFAGASTSANVELFNTLIPNIAIQHASRNQESLFFMSDLAKESIFKIEPSGLPKADYLCVMGKLGMELALKSGYDPKKVLLTGSPRFDHVIRRKKELFKKKKLCVIFAASGVVDIEVPAFIMAVKAIKSISNVELVLREHFFWKISSFSKIKDCLNDIEVSCLSLDEDLERADLILYTTTTLAEEALMRSIPVWQIASIKSNFSALRDVKQVKKIYSEDELKIALSFFIKSNDNLHANFEVAFFLPQHGMGDVG